MLLPPPAAPLVLALATSASVRSRENPRAGTASQRRENSMLEKNLRPLLVPPRPRDRPRKIGGWFPGRPLVGEGRAGAATPAPRDRRTAMPFCLLGILATAPTSANSPSPCSIGGLRGTISVRKTTSAGLDSHRNHQTHPETFQGVLTRVTCMSAVRTQRGFFGAGRAGPRPTDEMSAYTRSAPSRERTGSQIDFCYGDFDAGPTSHQAGSRSAPFAEKGRRGSSPKLPGTWNLDRPQNRAEGRAPPGDAQGFRRSAGQPRTPDGCAREKDEEDVAASRPIRGVAQKKASARRRNARIERVSFRKRPGRQNGIGPRPRSSKSDQSVAFGDGDADRVMISNRSMSRNARFPSRAGSLRIGPDRFRRAGRGEDLRGPGGS